MDLVKSATPIKTSVTVRWAAYTIWNSTSNNKIVQFATKTLKKSPL